MAVIGRAIALGHRRVGAGMCLAISISIGACGPKVVTQSHTQAEGGNDDERRYGTTPPLGNPPTIDLTAPAADYLIEVSTQIQPAWASFLEDCRLRLPQSNALNDSTLFARLEMTADGSGKVLSIATVKSSGNSDFDAVANEILSDLQSLPEPPPEWISDDRVHVAWTFARDIRQASSIGGSIRRVDIPIAEVLQRLLEAGKVAQASQRILDAGGRTIPTAQLDEVLHRALQLAISEDDPRVAAQALELVSDAALAGFEDSAREALQSSDDELARAAANALGSIGDMSDVARLSEIARGERTASAQLCAAAGKSLGLLGQEPQTQNDAAEDLKSPRLATRLAALAVLSQLEALDAVGALGKVLLGGKSVSREERVGAAAALGKQAPKSAKARKALLAGANSSDAAVRIAVLSALTKAAKAGMRSRVAYFRARELVRNKDERVRAAAIQAAASLEARRFAKELKSIRAGGSQLVLLSIASVLGDLPGDLATQRLLDLAAAPDASMRQIAALGLAKQENDKAEIALQTLVNDESAEVRAAALSALKHEPRLKILVQDSAPQVQVAALATLITRVGASKVSKMMATKLAASAGDRALQVQLAQAWHRRRP